MIKINDLKIGIKIKHPLGGIATIYDIDETRVYFKNGGFSGSCHYKDIKEIINDTNI